MKLLANENFPKASVLALRNRGYDVLSIGEENPSIEDHEVVDIAINEERLILTFDRDYGELVFKKGLKPPKGIIYLRIDPFSPEEPAEVISKLIQSQKFSFDHYLTVVDNNFIRQRKY
jgi:predicted nuclease of predicted toxin-antitoxin system